MDFKPFWRNWLPYYFSYQTTNNKSVSSLYDNPSWNIRYLVERIKTRSAVSTWFKNLDSTIRPSVTPINAKSNMATFPQNRFFGPFECKIVPNIATNFQLVSAFNSKSFRCSKKKAVNTTTSSIFVQICFYQYTRSIHFHHPWRRPFLFQVDTLQSAPKSILPLFLMLLSDNFDCRPLSFRSWYLYYYNLLIILLIVNRQCPWIRWCTTLVF